MEELPRREKGEAEKHVSAGNAKRTAKFSI